MSISSYNLEVTLDMENVFREKTNQTNCEKWDVKSKFVRKRTTQKLGRKGSIRTHKGRV